MLYIIGLGLNERGISLEGLEAIKKSKKIYLESYTVDFPYPIKQLEKIIGKKIIQLDREQVENENLLEEARVQNISLLIYGAPLFATTHISLIQDAKKQKVKTKIIYSAGIFDAIGETGLQLYKIGKITSMPKWERHFEPDSFLESIQENHSINAHSLILIDLGLDSKTALTQLETASKNKNVKLDKIVICSLMGTEKAEIFYGKIKDLKKKKIPAPFCIIIPERMHFIEKEVVEMYKV